MPPVAAGSHAITSAQATRLHARAYSRGNPPLHGLWCLLLLCFALDTLAAPTHALTVYGEAPLRRQFPAFRLCEPQRPGMLRRSAIEIGQFDHILPYIDKGIGVSQVDGLLFAPWPCAHSTNPTPSTG